MLEMCIELGGVGGVEIGVGRATSNSGIFIAVGVVEGRGIVVTGHAPRSFGSAKLSADGRIVEAGGGGVYEGS